MENIEQVRRVGLGPADLDPPGPDRDQLTPVRAADLDMPAATESLYLTTPPYRSWLPWPSSHGVLGGGGYAFESGAMYSRSRSPDLGGQAAGECTVRTQILVDRLPAWVDVRPTLKYDTRIITDAVEYDWRVQARASLRVYSAWSEGDELQYRTGTDHDFIARSGSAANGYTGRGEEEWGSFALHPAPPDGSPGWAAPPPFYAEPGELLLVDVILSTIARGRWQPDAFGRYAQAFIEVKAQLLWITAASA